MADIYLKDIDKNELIEAIAERVVELLCEHNDDSKSFDLILNRREAAQRLGISLPTLHKYTISGKVKGHRVGRTVRYWLSDINQALEKI